MASKINPGWRPATDRQHTSKNVNYREAEDYPDQNRQETYTEKGPGPAAIVQLSEEAVNLLKEMRRKAQEEHEASKD